ncbi:protein UBASH3A homolog [Dreissena polymorpha]|uniref:UBA domain-containing protein n=1 Tax=Dreissena polymorpha TaxID=45954 RepID=A0A9D4MZT0_DREPO|nr:protein UBASH3A homolog [Dreissena polymorpha]KAH3887013.1 hypothetical protein DPMN_011026 [Dreissena polymorpha]
MDKAPPPRRRKSSVLRREDLRSPKDILQQMGFSKSRAEKALAATGDRGVQIASDWLLSHVNDPELDKCTPRQYVLYLCPVGPLQEQLSCFYDTSLKMCGWNGAHNYFPHVTLCPFFTAEDSKSQLVAQALQVLSIYLESCPGQLKMDFFSQNNFIGLFMQDKFYKYFAELVSVFGNECKKHGITVEPVKKQLHITLAYQYLGENHEELMRLAREIDLESECQWEVRLYSREPQVGKSEVRRVRKLYQAQLDDEMDLIEGDCVFMDASENTRSTDKWFYGTSWLTGKQGMFPGPYTDRTAETWTWALHGTELMAQQETEQRNGETSHPQPTASGAGETYEALWKPVDVYAKVDLCKKKGEKVKVEMAPTAAPRKLVVMRHGERMDFVFGRSWVELCFDEQGNYRPCDLNMPASVPKRCGHHYEYAKDAPLTVMGQYQAQLTGEALKAAGVVFTHAYASPSLRCVQTATSVLKAMGQLSTPICVEPGLFEWLGWYQLGLPKFFSPKELEAEGYIIDQTYKPFFSVKKYDIEEKIHGYYRRSGETARNIAITHQHDRGSILIVGHAGSLEVCTRQILGHPPRAEGEFRDLCSRVPYCGLLAIEEDPHSKKWKLLDPLIHTLSHGTNKQTFVHKMLYPS